MGETNAIGLTATAAAAVLLAATAPAPSQPLRAGDEAPDFALKTLDGSAEVQLSSYRGECPVALLFGSYT